MRITDCPTVSLHKDEENAGVPSFPFQTLCETQQYLSAYQTLHRFIITAAMTDVGTKTQSIDAQSVR